MPFQHALLVALLTAGSVVRLRARAKRLPTAARPISAQMERYGERKALVHLLFPLNGSFRIKIGTSDGAGRTMIESGPGIGV